MTKTKTNTKATKTEATEAKTVVFTKTKAKATEAVARITKAEATIENTVRGVWTEAGRELLANGVAIGDRLTEATVANLTEITAMLGESNQFTSPNNVSQQVRAAALLGPAFTKAVKVSALPAFGRGWTKATPEQVTEIREAVKAEAKVNRAKATEIMDAVLPKAEAKTKVSKAEATDGSDGIADIMALLTEATEAVAKATEAVATIGRTVASGRTLNGTEAVALAELVTEAVALATGTKAVAKANTDATTASRTEAAVTKA